jgi:hypothetical protein
MEPIAVIGYSMTLPQDVVSGERFIELIRQKVRGALFMRRDLLVGERGTYPGAMSTRAHELSLAPVSR